ncbi:MAG: serine/threonine protein phosphatase [Thermomonas sp.]
MSVRSIVVEGQRAWEKHYDARGKGARRFRRRALDLVARRLDIGPLRPPPHPVGAQAKQVEARRLRELRALGIRIPEILGETDDRLRLSDLGHKLASRLRAAKDDPAAVDALASAAIAAIAEAHRRGAYFGQPLPRNIAVGEEGIGFFDFEEDPLEVMTLEQAQARDWLLFVHGMAKYYATRPDALAQLLSSTLHGEPGEVSRQVHRVGERLGNFARVIRWLGQSARSLANSIFIAYAATTWSVVVALLAIDFIADGEFDLLHAILGQTY